MNKHEKLNNDKLIYYSLQNYRFQTLAQIEEINSNSRHSLFLLNFQICTVTLTLKAETQTHTEKSWEVKDAF